MGETQQITPETKKPTPVSTREYQLMDRHEKRAFERSLSKGEKKEFQMAVMAKLFAQPVSERREIMKARVAKLSARENTSLGDKMELAFAKLQEKQLSLPKKEPVFFRKFRTGEPKAPKFLASAKSPYLIG